MNEIYRRLRLAWCCITGQSVIYNVALVQYEDGWIMYKKVPKSAMIDLTFYLPPKEELESMPSSFDETMMLVMTPEAEQDPMNHLRILGEVGPFEDE